MKTANYRFKQAELYTIARLILSGVSTLLARFSAFKGKYTSTWVADRLTEVDKAEDKPDEEQRSAKHQTLHVELDKKVQQALDKFNALKRYIVEVFNQDLWEIKINAAGHSYYADAANGDFDATAQLLKSASQFVNDNLTQLLDSGNNMPATFQTELDTLKSDFQTLQTNFLGSEAGAEVQTENKIDANNAIYQVIISINADAQSIFIAEEEEAERQQFVLEHQLFLVRGAGVAGMRFHVTDNTTGNDVADATITIKTDVVLTTDENGRALKLQLAADTYKVKIEKTGYTTQNIDVTVTTGTVKRVEVKL